MSKHLKIGLFVVWALVMVGTVSVRFLQAELVRRYGEEFVVPITGFDPRDPFRGRYLQFRMPNEAAGRAAGLVYGAERAWVPLSVGPDGLAHFGILTEERPDFGPALRVKLRYSDRNFVPPFERYYINERKVAKAEKLLLEAQRNNQARLRFRVKDGFAVLVAIELDGKDIETLLN